MLLELPAQGLPDYTVRVSSRAKYLRLTVSATHGIVVVVPKGFNQGRIPALLEGRKAWLAKAIAKVHQRQRYSVQQAVDGLPEIILLTAINRRWSVEYQPTQAGSISVMSRAEQCLVVRGNIQDRNACRTILRRWLARQAHLQLVPWLRTLSEQHGLTFGKATIKGQKTRWGSCSSERTISLNYRLLFVPSYLVRYVLLHELCHTVFMNHSRQYWELLGSLEPNCKALRRELREHWLQVPAWVVTP